MYKIFFLFLILAVISCNEDGPVNNGSDKTVIEKTLTPSNTEINLTTSDGINITIPAGALNSNLDIKVIKLANPPASTDSKLKVGSNVFKISLIGMLDFNDDIIIRVKYDKSKIQSGLTVLNGVKGIVYVNNSWQNVDCDFDIIKEEIVFYLNPKGKINKFSEKLQEENSITLGDGYSMLDTSNSDKLLVTLLDYDFGISFKGDINGAFNSDALGMSVDNFEDETRGKIIWTGNKFTIIGNYSAKDNQTDSLFITGEINPQTFVLTGFRFEHYSFENLGSSGTDAFTIVTCNNMEGELIEYLQYPKALRFDYNNQDTKIKFKTIIKHIDVGWTNWYMDGGNKFKEEYNLTSYDKEYEDSEFWFHLHQRK